MRHLLTTACILMMLCTSLTVSAQQSSKRAMWDDITTNQNRLSSESWMRSLSLDENAFSGLLNQKNASKSNVIDLPYPDGSFKSFSVQEYALMNAELASKYPSIKTYKGVSLDGKTKVRLDFTPQGFHAIIFDPEGTVYIDPNDHNSRTYYNSYKRTDFKSNRSKIFIEDEIVDSGKIPFKTQSNDENAARPTSSGTELRLYRIAIATTGEYATFHGGTVELTLAAIVTTMNRVTGIYENDVAVTFEIIANNDLIIYTDANTDPYDNNDASGAINTNQTNLDAVIGTENYDIGHVFSTGSGGLAQLQSVCSSSGKARGTTGTNNPTGDPFDVDFVAHEIGHQFGGNHTFNGSSGNCSGLNRNGSTAYEPGSGTTIMAYAGICAPQDIASNSDAYFHVVSLEEIVSFTTIGGGNSCAVVSNTGNTPPEVTVPTDIHTIPVNTPFALSGSATDVDQDILTYSWEQYDLGPTGHPNSPESDAAIFRFFPPKENGERTFPQLSDILGQTQTLGEILPSYSRELNFQLVVRDNRADGGGINTGDLKLNVTDAAGPFAVTSQADADLSFPQGAVQAVLWDVAGTAGAAVNCQNVKITLSLDGGQTFTEVLAESTPNDGSENITIPNVATTQGRIKVEAVDNVFFNISSSDFTIIEVTEPDFYLTIEPAQQTVCAPADGTYTVSAGGLLNFNDDITLGLANTSTELTYDFSVASIKPGETSTLTVSGTGSSTIEDNPFDITGTSGSLNHDIGAAIKILPTLSTGPTLVSPADNESEVLTFVNFTWDALTGAKNYTFELATDANFANVIQTNASIIQNQVSVEQGLDGSSTYYWRVKGTNDCGDSDYATASFNTLIIDCSDYAATDVPLDISPSGANEVISSIEVTDDFTVNDVNIAGLDISHTYIEDLTISLVSPDGTSVDLLVQPCGDSDDILLNIDSESTNSTIPCPATDGGTYQSASSLTAFNEKSSLGTWQLKVNDAFNLDGGSINGWTLQLCTIPVDIVLTAELISAEQIDLSWVFDNPGTEVNFELEVSEDAGLSFSTLSTLDAGTSSFSHTGLNSISRYDYKIRSVLASGPGNYSKVVIQTTSFADADAPTDLTATMITSGSNKNVDLTWTDNSDGELGFRIERKQDAETEWTELETTTETSYSDKGLEIGTSNTYRVLAFNVTDSSLPSNEVTIAIITALKDEILQEITLFPNPSNGDLAVNFGKASIELESIKVINIGGETVFEDEFGQKIGKEININLAKLNKGLYFVNIQTPEGVVVKKWIKN